MLNQCLRVKLTVRHVQMCESMMWCDVINDRVFRSSVFCGREELRTSNFFFFQVLPHAQKHIENTKGKEKEQKAS